MMKIAHYLLGAAAMLFSAASNAQEPAASVDPNFYIFLCFGQSNMEGQGSITDADRNVDERFLAMNTTDCDKANGNALYSWRKAVPPLARCGVGLGPVDYFGRLLIDSLAPHNPNIRIGVVDVAVAGCSIQLFDTVDNADLEYAKTAADWMKDMIAAYGGRPYARLVDAAREAQKAGVIKGILLHQGETNNGDQNWPKNVKNIYDSIISQLNLNAAEVPLLVGEMISSEKGGACSWHNTVIATVPNVIPNSYIVSTANLDCKDDKLHFTDNSYRILGKRYAKQWMRSIGMTINELPDIVEEKDVTACDKYNWNGKKYTSSRKLTSTEMLVDDQKKVTVINLTIKKSVETELEPVTVESSYTWPVDGKTYTKSQTLVFEGEAANGCDSIVTCELTVGSTAIGDVHAEQVTIFPSPVNNVLNISVPACAVGQGKVAIYTLAGIEVLSNDFVSEFESIDVSDWNRGVYVIQITDADGNVWTKKFVKSTK